MTEINITDKELKSILDLSKNVPYQPVNPFKEIPSYIMDILKRKDDKYKRRKMIENELGMEEDSEA